MNTDHEKSASGAVDEARERMRAVAGKAEQARGEAADAPRKWGRKARDNAGLARRKLSHAADRARDHLAKTGATARRQLRAGSAQLHHDVRQHPLAAILAAAGLGLALGVLLTQRRS